ncbi:uncharacterized protein TNCV_236401 [Trichonephila clavipes]|nr:uncharacterized protein TNCV_236401 [Trichonephila clavipes]
MIEDLIEDTSWGIEFKVKILVEGTVEIGVRVQILVEDNYVDPEPEVGYFQLAVNPSDTVKMGGLRNDEWYVRIPAYAIQAVRGGSQLSEDARHYFATGDRERPVVCASRTLSSVQKNYTVTEWECLAVVWVLNKLRTYLGSVPVKVITDHAILMRLTNGTQNAVADVLSRNPVENIIGEKVNCAIIRDLVLSSREQLIEEQRRNPEPGHIYRYLENPEDSSVNATICTRHVKTVVYRHQANRTEHVNRDLVQMVANCVNDQHDTWDQFLREFAYAIRTAVIEKTGKTPAELFLGRKLTTPLQKLLMVPDETEFAVGDIEKLFDEVRRNTKAKHEKWAKYYDRRRVLEVKQNNLVVWRSGKKNNSQCVDQVKLYHHRKSDEIEIRTSSSDNNSSSYRSNNFEGLRKDQGERHTSIASNRRPLVRSLLRSWTEPNRRTKQCKKDTLIFKRSGSGGPERKNK